MPIHDYSKPATLFEALRYLAEMHTGDDDVTGFVVHHVPRLLEGDQSDYVRAWRIVREQLRLQTEPVK